MGPRLPALVSKPLGAEIPLWGCSGPGAHGDGDRRGVSRYHSADGDGRAAPLSRIVLSTESPPSCVQEGKRKGGQGRYPAAGSISRRTVGDHLLPQPKKRGADRRVFDVARRSRHALSCRDGERPAGSLAGGPSPGG